jgi:hypothetical protein
LLTKQRYRRIDRNPEHSIMADGVSEGTGSGEEARPPAAIAPASMAPAGEPTVTGSATPQAQAGDGTPPAIEAVANDLPVVESPRLDGEETIAPSDVEAPVEAPDEVRTEPVGEAAAPMPLARSLRFALLAASIALAAAFGSFFGSLSASGIVRLSAAGPATSSTADAHDVVQAMKAQLAELSAMKANFDSATRSANTQSAKIAHIADTVDRLDKRSFASAETTGSIAAAPPPALEPKPPVLEGWIVEDVQNGRALVATRNGGVFEVGAGSFLPGIGRVEAIKREDGKWIVVTARGLITSVH